MTNAAPLFDEFKDDLMEDWVKKWAQKHRDEKTIFQDPQRNC